MYSRNKQKDKRPWAGFFKLNIVSTAFPAGIVASLYGFISLAVGNAI